MSEPIDLSQYYSAEQLHEMGNLEKRRLANLVLNYHQLLKLGIDAKKPDFMKKPDEPPKVAKRHYKPSKRSTFQPPPDVNKPAADESNRRSGRVRKEVERYAAQAATKISFDLLTDVDVELSDDDGDPEFDPKDLDCIDEEVSEPELNVEPHSSAKRRKVTKKQTNVKMIVTQKKILPKRKCVGVNKSYQKDEVIEDDTYIFCFDCNKEFIDGCSEHILLPLMDTQVPLGTENRAERTLPEGLSLSASKINKAGQGVWCDAAVKKNTRFGPYEGVVKPSLDVNNEVASKYGGLVKQSEEKLMYIDSKDETVSNWLRYVNCSRNRAEQNCDAFQYRGKIYYISLQDIKRGQELLVWYGDDYASDLGINKLKYIHPLTKTSTQESGGSAEVKLHHCPVCRCPFVNLYCMKRHESRAHSSTGKGVHYVRDRSRASSSLYTHVTKHTAEKTFKCELCNYRTTQSNHLHRHMGKHTGERPFKCELCDYRATQSNHLHRHMRKHTGERPFKCELCDYTATSDLHTHMRTHSGVKPFKCELCDYKTVRSSDLHTHMRTHTGERPFKCELCDYKAAQSSHLHRHMRTHTGETPYKCELCDYKTTRSSHLHRHMSKHTIKTPFKCEVCDYRCTVSSSLRTHMRQHI